MAGNYQSILGDVKIPCGEESLSQTSQNAGEGVHEWCFRSNKKRKKLGKELGLQGSYVGKGLE